MPDDRTRQRRNEQAYRERHREEIRARARVYTATHREERRHYFKAWRIANASDRKAHYVANRAEICARRKAVRNVDKERARWRAFYVAYRASHPDMVRLKYREQSAKRKAAKLRTMVEDIDYAKVIRDADGVCGICRRPFDLFGIHIDHIIPLSRGGAHTYDNLQATHSFCNVSKGAKVG